MTARFTLDPPLASSEPTVGPWKPPKEYVVPLASATSWAGRQAQTRAAVKAIAIAEAEIDAIFHRNEAQRNADAAAYGEPENKHEFYHGRPGSQAERIVLDCLREIQKIPETDNLYAKELTDAISKVYLQTRCSKVRMRRIGALLDIGVEIEITS
jgi:hypothetical protein